MRNFRLIAEGLDVDEVLIDLERHPQIWGTRPQRIAVPGSPHAQSQDIWLRFRSEAELHQPADYGAPHWAVFYPEWGLLTALHPMVFDLMRRVQATYLGGILITRIPQGAAILPHIDTGWHPETMDLKAYIVLKANPFCINRCGEESVVMAPGEAWAFRNDISHAVENGGDEERIAVILTMRTA